MAPSARARLQIRLLGPPEILIDGRPLAVDTRKAVAILALLAADGRPYARDELAALLWPESDDMAARGALRRTLSTMRAALDDRILSIDRSRVDLHRAQVWIDLGEIERAATSGDRRVLTAAADRIRGPFMAGFNLRDSPEFDDWRAARAVAAERSVLAVLDRLAVAAEADGDLGAAIGAAGRRLDLDPLDESGHIRLMDLLAASGDRAAALRQYRACVAILERELGVLPLASTTARYEVIRDAPTEGPVEPVIADRVAPRPVQVDRAPLVARDEAVGVVMDAHAATADGTGRVAVITGEAGIGKTRVAEATTDMLRERGAMVLAARAYPGERAIAYAPIVELLRSATALPDGAQRIASLEPDVRTELGRLLPSLDPQRTRVPASGPGAHARLVAAIADGLVALTHGQITGVVWIDDLQWADGATLEALDYLGRRLRGHPILLLLAWRTEDLDDAARPVTDRLAAPPAVVTALDRLDRDAIADLIAASLPDRPADPATIDRLVAASEGLPLYVVEALAAGSDALESMPVGVRSVLRGRLASVGETAAQVLTAASVIGRSFDLATVRHASGRSEGETVDAIDEALRRGLIREQAAAFDFAHGGLRDLAYESTSLTRRRLLHRRIAEALRLDLPGSGRDDLARLALIATHERDGGRTAEAAEAFRVVGERAAAVFANREAIDHDQAALALSHPDVAGLHAAIGRLRTRLGEYAAALASFEVAASVAEPAVLPDLERAIALVHVRRGDLLAAERHLADALAGSSDGAFLARVLVDLSATRRRMGDGDGALASARDALAAADAVGDVAAKGYAQRMLGIIALDSGDLVVAREASALAVAAAADDLDPTALIAALTSLAMAEAAAGALDDALGHAAEAVGVCRRIGDRHLEAAVENHVADLLHGAGREADSLVHLRRAVEAFAEVGGDPADPDPGIWMLSAS